MSITALVAGKLVADPERRTGASGKPFCLARLVAHNGEADEFVSLIAFGSVAEQLAAMGKGDAIAVTGRAKLDKWTGRDGESRTGLSLTADALLTPYHLKRKRQAVNGEQRPAQPSRQAHAGADDFCHGDDAWLAGDAP